MVCPFRLEYSGAISHVTTRGGEKGTFYFSDRSRPALAESQEEGAFMRERVPGPLCSTRVGDNWIDLGTMCRSRLSKPGPIGGAEVMVKAALNAVSPLKAKFDREHVYSQAREAVRKRDIDLQIIDAEGVKS